MNYEVFARLRQGDDLTHIGRVDAESDRLAKYYARTTFDEEDWYYLAVVPSDDVLEVKAGSPRAASPSAGGERA